MTKNRKITFRKLHPLCISSFLLFTVTAVKLVYGGVYKGSSYPVVAIVRTSDEVDSRDVLVKTSSPSNGTCIVESLEILADGLLPEDPALDFP